MWASRKPGLALISGISLTLLLFAPILRDKQTVVHAQSATPATRAIVVLDPAHGGTDPGATLDPGMLEKDTTLALSVSLMQALNAAGIATRPTRSADQTTTPQQRIATAQSAGAIACLSIHATASGEGVHIFTALQPEPDLSGPPLLPWSQVQLAILPDSRALARTLQKSLEAAGIPVTLGQAAVSPLEAFACPAVALEAGPRAGSGGASLSGAEYRQQITRAVSAALQQWKNKQPGRRP